MKVVLLHAGKPHVNTMLLISTVSEKNFASHIAINNIVSEMQYSQECRLQDFLGRMKARRNSPEA